MVCKPPAQPSLSPASNPLYKVGIGITRVVQIPRPKHSSADEFIRRYLLVTAHLIAESFGYFTPLGAARSGIDAIHGRENWCEYISTCFDRNARACLERAIRNRHHHHGYMAESKLARRLVDRYLEKGTQPPFASWF